MLSNIYRNRILIEAGDKTAFTIGVFVSFESLKSKHWELKRG